MLGSTCRAPHTATNPPIPDQSGVIHKNPPYSPRLPAISGRTTPLLTLPHISRPFAFESHEIPPRLAVKPHKDKMKSDAAPRPLAGRRWTRTRRDEQRPEVHWLPIALPLQSDKYSEINGFRVRTVQISPMCCLCSDHLCTPRHLRADKRPVFDQSYQANSAVPDLCSAQNAKGT